MTAYLLASTTMIPIVGKLSDQFGRKWFLLVGTSIFLTGSALSGRCADDRPVHCLPRATGLGAGVGIALVFTVVGDIFPPAERAKWQGIFGSVYGFSASFGPTLGGWLTDHGPLARQLWSPTPHAGAGSSTSTSPGHDRPGQRCWSICPPTSPRAAAITPGWAAIRRIDFPGALLAAAATHLSPAGPHMGR